MTSLMPYTCLYTTLLRTGAQTYEYIKWVQTATDLALACWSPCHPSKTAAYYTVTMSQPMNHCQLIAQYVAHALYARSYHAFLTSLLAVRV